MAATNLARSLTMGSLTLKNRILMASLTRNRCPGTYPAAHNAEYYAQRAGAGLVLSEGALIAPIGSEWPSAPGIHTARHAKAWKAVTDAVHAKGGLIFCQLWHIGRVAHPLHQAGMANIAPSAIAAKGGEFRLLEGKPGYVVPEAIDDPKEIVAQYANAARLAKEAGFDGVELHAANGYLPVQFLESHSNARTDAYGGSVANRCRFVTETVDAMIKAWGGDSKRVGIKLSPGGGYNDAGEGVEGAKELYSHLAKELNARKIGYAQFSRYLKGFDWTGRGSDVAVYQFKALMPDVLFFANADFTAEEAEATVAAGKADAVVFGRPYITNPDLAERILSGKALNMEMDFPTFYGVPEGKPLSYHYSDYPAA